MIVWIEFVLRSEEKLGLWFHGLCLQNHTLMAAESFRSCENLKYSKKDSPQSGFEPPVRSTFTSSLYFPQSSYRTGANSQDTIIKAGSL